MFAGVGPILGAGVKAYTQFPDRPAIEHYYAKSEEDYLLISDSLWACDKNLPAVILIGSATGSAGELLALAFRGNPKTKLMGEPTYGVSTDLTSVFMPDSFQICIASGIMTDRFNVGDGGSIQPDILIHDAEKIYLESYKWIDSNQL